MAGWSFAHHDVLDNYISQGMPALPRRTFQQKYPAKANNQVIEMAPGNSLWDHLDSLASLFLAASKTHIILQYVCCCWRMAVFSHMQATIVVKTCWSFFFFHLEWCYCAISEHKAKNTTQHLRAKDLNKAKTSAQPKPTRQTSKQGVIRASTR